MKEFPEIIVNDLYHFTKPNHSLWWAAEGNVHFNKMGRKAQGDKVADIILSTIKFD